MAVPAEIGEALAGHAPIEEVSAAHPWAGEHRIFTGYAPSGQALSAAFVEGEEPVLLGGEGGLSRLGALMVRERGALPGGLSAAALAHAIRRLTVGPRGALGGAEAARVPLRPGPGFDPGPFAQDPVLHDLGEGRFMLRFFFFTPAGAVELWDVLGDASRFLASETRHLAPAGSFGWPYR